MSKNIEMWVNYKCVHCGKQIKASPNYKPLCEHKTSGKNPKRYTYPFDFESSDFNKAPDKLQKIVSDKNYLNLLLKESSKRIVGEEKSQKALMVCLLGGRLVINSKTTSYNSLLSEQSGAGKDYEALNIIQLLPKHFWESKTRLSEKALSYWHPSEKEPFWNWNGKLLYVEDVTNYFLNSDTVKVMMTGGSDIAIVDKGELKTIKVNGSPIFLITSATAEPNKELNRRITSIPLDASESQTDKILSFQSKTAISGTPQYNEDIINSAYLLSRVTVDIPFAEKLRESFPKNLQSRTNFDRLLDMIKAHAALHQYSRENKKGSIISNEEDLNHGLEIFQFLYPSRNTSLTHAQQKLVDYLKGGSAKPAGEIFRAIGFEHYSQIGTMIKGLNSLASKGFIKIFEDEHNGRSVDFYEYIEDLNPIDIKVSSISNISNVNKVNKVSTKEDTGDFSNKKELTLVTPLTSIIETTQLTQSTQEQKEEPQIDEDYLKE